MYALSKLTINLQALANNFGTIQQKIGPHCVAGAAVKANAYGLGLAPVAQKLEGQTDLFFVATADEALALRAVSKKPIATLNGLVASPDFYRAYNIWPVLGSYDDLERVSNDARKIDKTFPCLIHIDTGMNRLGLNAQELEKVINYPDTLRGLDIQYAMSHFISSENHTCPLAQQQFEKFMHAAKGFGHSAKLSIANSGGIFRDPKYHLDLVRPGSSLYGVNPTPHTTNPMNDVVKLEAQILKIQTVQKGETVGYDATHTLTRTSKLATVSLGYADGFLRSLSNKGRCYWQGHACPVVGRVSMDLTVIDITDLPDNVPQPHAGDWVEIIGLHQSVDDIAKQAGTNGYEILCALSHRAERIYLNA